MFIKWKTHFIEDKVFIFLVAIWKGNTVKMLAF